MGFDEAQQPYQSQSQRARVWTEAWAGKWLYCPNCCASRVNAFENNRPAADFFCGGCQEQYEIKSTKGNFGAKVVDGAYSTLCERLSSDTSPNFAFLSYHATDKLVRDLFVVPKQFMSIERIEMRKPLAPTARRAGWIGCNILLGQIPLAGKIFVVRGGIPEPIETVRANWQKTLFLRKSTVEARGWLVEVMICCEQIGKPEFEIADVYAFEKRLSNTYPGNNHVREKIRQQLQLLRDHGYLEFQSRGRYRIVE